MSAADSYDAVAELASIKAQFDEDGFVVVRGFLSSRQSLEAWRVYSEESFNRLFQDLHNHGHTELSTHCQVTEHGQRSYAMELGVKNGFREIVMRSPGRYEVSLLHIEHSKRPSLEHLQTQFLPIAVALLEADSADDITLSNISFVVSTPGAGDQSWHADGGHIHLQEHRPCHCLNIFVPLSSVHADNGPTEFRPGTHYHTRNLAPMMLAARARKTLRPPTAPTLSVGDVLVFDYRVLHRGRANRSEQKRTFLVLTYCRAWFKDVLNFPSRSLYIEATGGESHIGR